MADAPAGPFLSPDFFVDPYPSYRELRATEPVRELDFGPWLLLRFEDVNRLLRDPRTGVGGDDEHQRLRFELATGRTMQRRAPSMLATDPPDHTRLRRLVQKAFTPKVIEDLRPTVQRLVDEQLDAVAARGNEMDVIADLAFPLPFTVISRMLGMPPADALELRELSHAMVKTLDPILTDDEIQRGRRCRGAHE